MNEQSSNFLADMALHVDRDLTLITAELVRAYISSNETPIDELPGLIQDVYNALAALGPSATPAEPTHEPVVTARASVRPDHVTCMVCGFKGKMLKRHLVTEHDLTPEEYRVRYKLPVDHPMVAPDYAETRRQLAWKIGLGRKPQASRGRNASKGFGI